MDNETLIENLYFDGFIHFDIDSNNSDIKKINDIVKNINNGEIKEGFSMESKYDRSADLRPTTVDYDNAFSNLCISLGVTSLLAEYLKYEPEINTVQLRAAFEGSSYLSWHRDTHKYNGEKNVAGNIPPLFKAIYYPHIYVDKPRSTLRVSAGSHLRYSSSKFFDINLPKLMTRKKVDIKESSDKILIFNTGLLHSVLSVKGPPIYRLITSFK